jgi:hypothetical protein
MATLVSSTIVPIPIPPAEQLKDAVTQCLFKDADIAQAILDKLTPGVTFEVNEDLSVTFTNQSGEVVAQISKPQSQGFK